MSSLDYSKSLYGGTIRYHYVLEDDIENVAVNNLMAVHNRFAADVQGNRHPGEFHLPEDFWRKVAEKCRTIGVDLNAGERSKTGGIKNIILSCTLHENEYDNRVYLYTPFNDLLWAFEISSSHLLLSRAEILNLVGKNKGFDLILPYNPYMPDPDASYAPPIILQSWIDEGYTLPLRVVEDFKSLPASKQAYQLDYWLRSGYTTAIEDGKRLSLYAPETLKLLGDSHESSYQFTLPEPRDGADGQAAVEGEFTILGD